jgi:hypothetical protein
MLRNPGAHFTEYAGASIDFIDTLAGMHGAADGLHLTHEQTHAKEWVAEELSVEGVPRRFSRIGDTQH